LSPVIGLDPADEAGGVVSGVYGTVACPFVDLFDCDLTDNGNEAGPLATAIFFCLPGGRGAYFELPVDFLEDPLLGALATFGGRPLFFGVVVI
jgi:hypothetical protein